MLRYLRDSKVDVAGLQEFEPSQRAAFRAQHSEYRLSTRGANSIVWDDKDFRLVHEQSVRIPYFNGHVIDMPVVKLEHRASGKQAWFVDVHNPADTSTYHHQVGHRQEALRREQALLDELRATGLPVYLVGDFNDRKVAHDAITGDGRTTSAAPANGRQEIDWIFGTGPARFTSYSADRGPEQTKTADHPIVVADTEFTN
jgi:endonuclease/exonuclease/phosphatase family metal-dependent hydrolase